MHNQTAIDWSNPPQPDEQRWIAHTAPPIDPRLPQPINPADWGAVGAAIWLCAMAGQKLLGIFTQQQSAESKAQELMITGLLKQNETLIDALVSKRQS